MPISLGRFLNLFLILVASGLFQSTVNEPGPSAAPQTDPYHLEFVQTVFNAFKSAQTNGISSIERKRYFMFSPSLPELGDSVSVAVVKLVDLNDLSEKGNTKVYLTLVIGAFSDRSRIAQKSDQEARVTNFVLEFLKEKDASNPILQKEIEYTEECARNFACTEQAKLYFRVHATD